MSEPLFIGIPLIARDSARDWSVVETLFARTLDSILAQDDPDFIVLLAGHDRPAAWTRIARDPRFRWLQADWPSTAPSAANDDGGRKKWLVKQAVRDAGGGLLLFLDADDWIARDLVRLARATIGPAQIGGLVTRGHALDGPSGHALPFPIGGCFAGGFHELCGSCTVARVTVGGDPALLDPHALLGSHHEWEAKAAALGLSLARLPTEGVYLVGTGENHSERQGPFAAWRREVTEAVRRDGVPLSPAMLHRFGQCAPLGQISASANSSAASAAGSAASASASSPPRSAGASSAVR